MSFMNVLLDFFFSLSFNIQKTDWFKWLVCVCVCVMWWDIKKLPIWSFSSFWVWFLYFPFFFRWSYKFNWTSHYIFFFLILISVLFNNRYDLLSLSLSFFFWYGNEIKMCFVCVCVCVCLRTTSSLKMSIKNQCLYIHSYIIHPLVGLIFDFLGLFHSWTFFSKDRWASVFQQY